MLRGVGVLAGVAVLGELACSGGATTAGGASGVSVGAVEGVWRASPARACEGPDRVTTSVPVTARIAAAAAAASVQSTTLPFPGIFRERGRAREADADADRLSSMTESLSGIASLRGRSS